MRRRGFRPTWSMVVCVLVVLGIVLAAPGTTLAKKGGGGGGGGGGDKFERVHYFVWYDLDPLGAFSPNEPDDTSGPYPYTTVAGGTIEHPDAAQLIITALQTKLSNVQPGVLPFGLASDDDVDADELADILFCFPSETEPYRGAQLIRTDADGNVTIQMNFHGLSYGGREKYYNLFVDVYRITDSAGETIVPAPGWNPLEMDLGETITLHFGQWELRAGTGRLDKGCHAFGDLSNEVENGVPLETGMKLRRFTAQEELDQRAQ